MNEPKTYTELVNRISEILPNATFDEDLEGQIIIYTDLEEIFDKLFPFGVKDETNS